MGPGASARLAARVNQKSRGHGASLSVSGGCCWGPPPRGARAAKIAAGRAAGAAAAAAAAAARTLELAVTAVFYLLRSARHSALQPAMAA